MKRGGERGASGLFILVVLILVALAVLATVALHRTTDAISERQNTVASLAKAGAALDAFAGTSGRLPCPANPNPLDPTTDGVEVQLGATGCQYTQGTLPWATLGMRRDDAYDSWGHKISYRVYTGGADSLTQPKGISVTDCDIALDGGGASATICQADHSTLGSNFFKGRGGLTVVDFGVSHTDAAYVVLSHGPTGQGSYTASGVRLDLPNGDEKDNTTGAGPFHVEAFSDPNTKYNANTHFDDLLFYRSITDIINANGLVARPWHGVLSAVKFDKDTLTSALGSTPKSDTGQSTIAFNNATVTAFDSSGNQDISYVKGTGSDPDTIGAVNGSDDLLGSAGSEGLRIDLTDDARQFAFTVDKFDDSAAIHERLELRFYNVVGGTATLKATQIESSCASNGKVTSYSLDACAAFNRVEIRPATASDGTSPSAFSLAEIRTCVDSVTCATDLQSTGNVCSTKTFSPCSVGAGDSSKLNITLVNPTSSPMTAASFTDTYPTGLLNVASPTVSNTCGGTATANSSDTSLALVNGVIPANGSCTVTVDVMTSSSPASYTNSIGNVTTSGSTLASVSGNLTALAQPTLALDFTPATVAANVSSVFSIKLSNSNANDITGAAFDEMLPTGLVVAGAPNPVTTCGGAIVADNSPNPHLKVTGGLIPAMATCSVSVNVTSASIGGYTATMGVGSVTTTNAGSNLVAAPSAALSVN